MSGDAILPTSGNDAPGTGRPAPQADSAHDATAESGGLRETPLHAQHVALGARMAPFGGWHMPIDYGSIVDEHNATRSAAGSVRSLAHGRVLRERRRTPFAS